MNRVFLKTSVSHFMIFHIFKFFRGKYCVLSGVNIVNFSVMNITKIFSDVYFSTFSCPNFRLGFALSNRPHLHRAYLVTIQA